MTCLNCERAYAGHAIKINEHGRCIECDKPFIFKSKNWKEIHARAMCAHSECLGLNSTHHFGEILQKWGLVDEKGEPTF